MLVFKAKKPRFTDAIPKDPVRRIPFLNVHRAADLKIGELSRLFEDAFSGVRKAMSVSMLVAIRQQGDLGRIEAAMEELRKRRPEMRRIISGIVADSGRKAAAEFVRRSGVSGSFNVTNQRAVDWAESRSATLVVQVGGETKRAIRQMIARAFTEGMPPAKAGRRIRPLIGLTRSQARAVERARERFLAAGISEPKAATLTENLAARIHRRRALLIARTETIASANYGQQEFWMQAVDDGLVPRTAKRKWIVTPDDRLEAKCEALRGVKVGMNEAFPGGVMNPPLHPGCRCTTGLVLS